MKTACIAYTDSGEKIAEKIKRGIEGVTIYKNTEYRDGIKPIFKEIFDSFDSIIFVSASGIAVRMIAPYIKDKAQDPAVAVVDDMGRFAISLLSGHIGGANELTIKISEVLGAQPVITTASDSRGIESVDMYAKRCSLEIENMDDVKKITSIMVNGGAVRFVSEIKPSINYSSISEYDYEGAIFVTSEEEVFCHKPYCVLRPKNLNIGIGCRRGKSMNEILDAVYAVFKAANLSIKSIKSISSIDVKKDEQGIIDACKYLKCPFNIFSGIEIKNVQDMFQKSIFVESKVGVSCVSEPCAYLAGGDIIVRKIILDGITVAVAREG